MCQNLQKSGHESFETDKKSVVVSYSMPRHYTNATLLYSTPDYF